MLILLTQSCSCRCAVYYEAWGSPPAMAFVPFMRWLDKQLRTRQAAWCCDPALTHFLPASRFTHWPSGLKAVTQHVAEWPPGSAAARHPASRGAAGLGSELSRWLRRSAML